METLHFAHDLVLQNDFFSFYANIDVEISLKTQSSLFVWRKNINQITKSFLFFFN